MRLLQIVPTSLCIAVGCLALLAVATPDDVHSRVNITHQDRCTVPVPSSWSSEKCDKEPCMINIFGIFTKLRSTFVHDCGRSQAALAWVVLALTTENIIQILTAAWCAPTPLWFARPPQFETKTSLPSSAPKTTVQLEVGSQLGRLRGFKLCGLHVANQTTNPRYDACLGDCADVGKFDGCEILRWKYNTKVSHLAV